MDAFGKIVSYLFFGGIVYILAVVVCLIWIIYKFVKTPRESVKMFLSVVAGVFIVGGTIFFTKSLWLDIDNKPEASIIGLLGSLCLVFVLTYIFNSYFTKKLK